MGAFCRVGLSGDYYLPSLQRAHRPRWTTLSASEPGAGDKLGARLRHSPRVCLVLHELALDQQAQLNKQLDDVKNASESTWDSVKDGFKKAYEKSKEGFQQARQWVSDKIAP